MKNKDMKTPSSFNGLRPALRPNKTSVLSRLKAMRDCGSAICVLLLIAAVTLLSGCHTNPPLPCKPLEPITLPALSQPLPNKMYSISAQESIEAWRKLLIVTPVTSKP